MPLREVASAVEELVQQERKALTAMDSFQKADEYMAQRKRLHPEDIVSKTLEHFQKLFEVVCACRLALGHVAGWTRLAGPRPLLHAVLELSGMRFLCSPSLSSDSHPSFDSPGASSALLKASCPR